MYQSMSSFYIVPRILGEKEGESAPDPTTTRFDITFELKHISCWNFHVRWKYDVDNITFKKIYFFLARRPNMTTLLHCPMQGRIQEFILGGAKPRSPIESWGRSPNRGREAPEYRGRSPSRGREAPEYRGRSPSRGLEAPENWGRSPNRGRSPRKSGGRGLGRGLGEPLPRKFLKNQTWNHSFWCIFEAIIWNDWQDGLIVTFMKNH